MKASFSLLLLAAVTAACARATGAVDDRADPAGPIEQPRAGAEEAALEVQVEQAKRDLRDRKRGKGGKGKRDDDQKDGAKARKSKSGKAKSGKGDTGTEHCLKGFNDILSVRADLHVRQGRYGHVYPDSLTGIDLKRPEEDSCQVPTVEYSSKIAFHANDSSTLFIDFFSNGGDSYYTEGEDDETRIATPYSDEGVRARRAEVCGAEVGNGLFSSCKGDGEYCGYNGNIRETGCWKDPNVCCSKIQRVNVFNGYFWDNYECGCGRNDGHRCGDCQEKGVESGRWFGGVYQSGKDIERIITPLCCGYGYAMKMFDSLGITFGFKCNEKGCIEAGRVCGIDGES
ncbi:hypothetical protein THAOC_33114 [Thalassiosira oceanica]|uniref:Uncharacterized protein n=1 Tax=Thalassiosira oceanica TaxID=159749 RepID=K0R7S8_THAOC|nr:hypothetical protein THAOC_33114 [Thalassiosira oceanica]|eukprot:EJK48119.1 hypothetical protein THAOC_33114 [Thalassiosira oceanica]